MCPGRDPEEGGLPHGRRVDKRTIPDPLPAPYYRKGTAYSQGTTACNTRRSNPDTRSEILHLWRLERTKRATPTPGSTSTNSPRYQHIRRESSSSRRAKKDVKEDKEAPQDSLLVPRCQWCLHRWIVDDKGHTLPCVPRCDRCGNESKTSPERSSRERQTPNVEVRHLEETPPARSWKTTPRTKSPQSRTVRHPHAPGNLDSTLTQSSFRGFT